MKDEKHNQDLKDWKIDLPDDTHFHSSVWREIAMRDATSPTNRLRESLDRLLVPRLAIPIAAAAVAMVLVSASLHGLRSRERTWESLGLAYNSAIDPIAHTEAVSYSLFED